MGLTGDPLHPDYELQEYLRQQISSPLELMGGLLLSQPTQKFLRGSSDPHWQEHGYLPSKAEMKFR